MKTRRKRGGNGGKWARYGLKRVKESGSPGPPSCPVCKLHSAVSPIDGCGAHADGLKDSLLLREDPAVNPSFKPDWSEWATVERTEVQDKAGMGEEKAEEVCPQATCHFISAVCLG